MTYQVIADYRDPRLASYRGPFEVFEDATYRYAEISLREHAVLRQVVIMNDHGIVVTSCRKW